MYELAECRKVHKSRVYIRLSAFDATQAGRACGYPS